MPSHPETQQVDEDQFEIRRMEAGGVVSGCYACIDETQIGFGFSEFVSLPGDQQIHDRLKAFEAEIRLFPEVLDR